MVTGGKKPLSANFYVRVRVTCVNKIEVNYEGRA